jgi:hypothetical protein
LLTAGLFNNEAMDDEAPRVEAENEASAASVNWETLFDQLEELKIDAEERRSNWSFAGTPAPSLDVTILNSDADLCDYANAPLMQRI